LHGFWVVQGTITPRTPQKKFERLGLLGTDLSQFAVKLEEPVRDISEIFPYAPLKGYLHDIVDVQSAGEFE
jgi:hypothetical protein